MKTITIDLNKNSASKGKTIKTLNLRASRDISSGISAKHRIKFPKVTLQNSGSKKTSPVKKIVLITLAVIVVGVLGYFGLIAAKTLKLLNSANIKLSPGEILTSSANEKPPELKQDENGLTNVLLVGIDTRPNDPGLQNTDTIIVATYNNKTQAVTLLSIPRDMWVEDPIYPGYFTKKLRLRYRFVG